MRKALHCMRKSLAVAKRVESELLDCQLVVEYAVSHFGQIIAQVFTVLNSMWSDI
jgi:hypothetical protein